MSKVLVQAQAHWGGDVNRFTGKLTVEVDTTADAANLAAVHRLLAGGDPEKLARLADAAERIVAEDLAAADPVLCG